MQISLIIVSALVSFSVASPTLQRRDFLGDDDKDYTCQTDEDCDSGTYCDIAEDGSGGKSLALNSTHHAQAELESQSASRSRKDLLLPGKKVWHAKLMPTALSLITVTEVSSPSKPGVCLS